MCVCVSFRSAGTLFYIFDNDAAIRFFSKREKRGELITGYLSLRTARHDGSREAPGVKEEEAVPAWWLRP